MFAFLTKEHEDEKTVTYNCETTIRTDIITTQAGHMRDKGETINGSCTYNKITKECHFNNSTHPYLIKMTPERVMIFEKLQSIGRSGEKFPQTITVRDK